MNWGGKYLPLFLKNGKYLPLCPKEVVSLSDLSFIKLRNPHGLWFLNS